MRVSWWGYPQHHGASDGDLHAPELPEFHLSDQLLRGNSVFVHGAMFELHVCITEFELPLLCAQHALNFLLVASSEAMSSEMVRLSNLRARLMTTFRLSRAAEARCLFELGVLEPRHLEGEYPEV